MRCVQDKLLENTIISSTCMILCIYYGCSKTSNYFTWVFIFGGIIKNNCIFNWFEERTPICKWFDVFITIF